MRMDMHNKPHQAVSLVCLVVQARRELRSRCRGRWSYHNCLCDHGFDAGCMLLHVAAQGLAGRGDRGVSAIGAYLHTVYLPVVKVSAG